MALTFIAAGCLGEPGIEDRWTRLDILDVQPPVEELTPGASVTLNVRGAVTYRSILTGTVAMEIRSSGEPMDLFFNEADRLGTAIGIEAFLENSSVLVGDTRSVTGFDHLIQEIDFTLDVAVPSVSEGPVALVFYFGDGETIELPSGEEVVLVKPFSSEERHVLPGGVMIVDPGDPSP